MATAEATAARDAGAAAAAAAGATREEEEEKEEEGSALAARGGVAGGAGGKTGELCAATRALIRDADSALARRAKSASRSSRRALLMPLVNPGSLYRCGKRE